MEGTPDNITEFDYNCAYLVSNSVNNPLSVYITPRVWSDTRSGSSGGHSLGSVSVAVAVVSDIGLVDVLALAESCPHRDSPGRRFVLDIVLIISSEKSAGGAPIWCCCISKSGNRDWEEVEVWLGLIGWWY